MTIRPTIRTGTGGPSRQTASSGRRWVRLIPIVFITYSIAFLDRSNFSIAAAGGLAHDLKLTSGSTGLAAASFFIGYVVFQIPGVMYADRRSIRGLIFWSLLAWGVLAMAQGFATSGTELIVMRFFLGSVEAAVLPALVILVARWFTSPERGRANALLILGNPITVLWLSAVSGYLITGVGWRGMFIIEGIPAIAWAFYFRHQVRDYPAQASWLDPAERDSLETALAAEQAELDRLTPADTTQHRPLLEALRSPLVVTMSVVYLLWSIGVYGFVFWLPTIVKAGSSANIGTTGLLSAIPYVFAVLAMVINSPWSDRSGHRWRHVWPWLLVGAVSFYFSYVVGTHTFWLSFLLLIVAAIGLYAAYGPFFAVISELLPKRTVGIGIAVVNTAGSTGAFIGTYLVGAIKDATGGVGAVFVFLACTSAAAGIIMLAASKLARKRRA